VALELVGDRERDLGAVRPSTHVESVAHDHLRVAPEREQAVPVYVVDVGETASRPVKLADRREEAEDA
jgi:hypothetical protein